MRAGGKEALFLEARGSGVPLGTPLPKVLPEGINHKRAYQSRRIAENPKIVAKIKAQARENEDIPTKTAVLNAISYEKEKARKEKGKKWAEDNKSKTMISLAWASYLLKLESVVMTLPKEPPHDVPSEAALNQAKGYAKIILNRLSMFLTEKED